MSMRYIRDTYGVPAKRGGRVRFNRGYGPPILGTITGSRGAHIWVRFDGLSSSTPLHPTWNLEYLEDRCDD